ncbi:hypothetical protein WICMUC_002243 [Wickerhamomyces mucosus]|uniref:Ketoreductase (KR) domain-containing protein n=1 Tax=Wickerhamomyces mucosus TaxID=1378264 RepID=A0A9P8PPL5_9ASCO|nr:hypothetical protein WICMUC_002243 [Wickerhamomyces mucosus]
MPLNIIGSMVLEGPEVIRGWEYIKYYGPIVATVGALKYYFRGTTNTWERDLHGKVYIITGGTSGLGASIVDELAARGAQLILLVRSTNDYWLAEYIQDLRDKHKNFLIYAEECDLSSLHSVRKFATKWLDNVPPRRIDGVICTASETLPPYKERQNTIDGIEIQTAVNYVGHYHLLTLLTPSLKAQLSDRDVRVLLTTCLSQAMGQLDINDPLYLNKRYPKSHPWTVLGTAKLQLGLFAKEFQRRLLETPRKDGAPINIRVNIINPGTMRSPSTKRVLSFGSILGLFLYLLILPILWIFFKSTTQGAQSFIHTLMSPDFVNLDGGNFISNCSIYKPARKEFDDSELQKTLYDNTAIAIAKVEKESAVKRKRNELTEKQAAEAKGNLPKVEEITAEKSKPNNINAIQVKKNKDKVPLFPGFDTDNGSLQKENSKIKSTSTKSKTSGKSKKSKKL